MSFYRDQVLPRVLDVVLDDTDLAEVRARVAARLSGTVLEVGFGSGLNVPFYPDEVRRVLAVDPATVGRKLAAKRVATSHVQVDYLDPAHGTLALEDESVDHVLVTWTMCTIPDVAAALREMHRVLRPGGQLHFAEHGRSPQAAVARWQDRLNPLQHALAGGCNLNRRIDRLVEGAGFELLHLENFYLKGPKVMGYMYEGSAAKPGPAGQ
jgi:ubiquinone/menaquinone biosynthesis C-methylase UbiE